MKSVLSDIFLKKGLYLEGLDNLMITITTIDVSPDLRHAKVYLTFINCSDSSEVIIKKLNRNAKNYKFIIGKEIRLKRIPNIRFFEDTM
mgnify:CR=1 FL=1